MRRAIFALLYDRGQFMLSRNFRLQNVGSVDWLFNNYDFAVVSHGLDELMVIDVSRGERNAHEFGETIRKIASMCFIPLTVGGGITSHSVAHAYMRSGADKLLINSAFPDDPALCRSLAAHFGRQCIVAGIDYTDRLGTGRAVMVENGTRAAAHDVADWVEHVLHHGAGEVLLQSMDRDGTGMGLDLGVMNELPRGLEVPCIVVGGVGTADHILEGLLHPAVDAVATANLFNFIGSAFLDARDRIVSSGVDMAQWSDREYESLRGRFGSAD